MILITGCAGFIGFHLAKKLLINKKKVIGIDCVDNYYARSKKYQRLKVIKKYDNFKFLKVDLNDYNKVNNFLKKYKIDAVPCLLVFLLSNILIVTTLCNTELLCLQSLQLEC